MATITSGCEIGKQKPPLIVLPPVQVIDTSVGMRIGADVDGARFRMMDKDILVDPIIWGCVGKYWGRVCALDVYMPHTFVHRQSEVPHSMVDKCDRMAHTLTSIRE
jgi:hypothetical protein